MDYSEDSCRSSYSSDYGSDLVEDYQGSGSYSGSSSSGETSNTIVSTSNTLRGHCESRVIGMSDILMAEKVSQKQVAMEKNEPPPDVDIEADENCPVDDFQFSVNGLSEIRARSFITMFGYNEFLTVPYPHWLRVTTLILRPVPTVTILTILFEVFAKEWVGVFILFALLLANVIIQLHSEQAIHVEDVLSVVNKNMAYSCTVSRDGEWITLAASALVPGDLILLVPGEIVPADCRVNAGSVEVDMKALIAENMDKYDFIPPSSSLGSSVVTMYMGDSVKMGSIVVGENEVEGTVEHTGIDTHMGKQMALMKGCRRSLGTSYGLILSRIVSALCIIWCFIGFWVWSTSSAKLALVNSGDIAGKSRANYGASIGLSVSMVAATLITVDTICMGILKQGAQDIRYSCGIKFNRISSIIDLAQIGIMSTCGNTGLFSVNQFVVNMDGSDVVVYDQQEDVYSLLRYASLATPLIDETLKPAAPVGPTFADGMGTSGRTKSFMSAKSSNSRAGSKLGNQNDAFFGNDYEDMNNFDDEYEDSDASADEPGLNGGGIFHDNYDDSFHDESMEQEAAPLRPPDEPLSFGNTKDPFDLAILAACDREALQSVIQLEYTDYSVQSFRQRRTQSTVEDPISGLKTMISKGAPHCILKLIQDSHNQALVDGHEMDEEVVSHLRQLFDQVERDVLELVSRGLRVMAVAKCEIHEGNWTKNPGHSEWSDDEDSWGDENHREEWTFVGLLSFKSPLRPHMTDIIQDLNRQCGILVKMMSNDHLWLAKATAESLSLGDFILSARQHIPLINEVTKEKPNLDPVEFGDCFLATDVFALAYPQQQYTVIDGLKNFVQHSQTSHARGIEKWFDYLWSDQNTVQKGLKVGVIAGNSSDVAAMMAADVSIAIQGSCSIAMAAADMTILSELPAPAINGLHTNNGTQPPPPQRQRGFAAVQVTSILLARVVIARLEIFLQYRITTFLYCLQLLWWMLNSSRFYAAILENPMFAAAAKDALHLPGLGTGLFRAPPIFFLLSSIFCDICVGLFLTAIEGLHGGKHAPPLFVQSSPLLVPVDKTNNFDEEIDPEAVLSYQQQHQDEYLKAGTSLDRYVCGAPSKFPHKWNLFSMAVLGTSMSLAAGFLSFYFIKRLPFLLKLALLDSSAENVVLVLPSNGLYLLCLWIYMFVMQGSMFLILRTEKEWFWRRSNLTKDSLLLYLGSILMLITALAVHFPSSLDHYNDDIGFFYYTMSIKLHPIFHQPYPVLDYVELRWFHRTVLILIIFGLCVFSVFVLDIVKVIVIYQLRKHNDWSGYNNNGFITFPPSTLQYITGLRSQFFQS